MGLVLSKKNYPKRVIHYPPSRKRLPSGSPGENVGANVEDDEDEEDYFRAFILNHRRCFTVFYPGNCFKVPKEKEVEFGFKKKFG